ncbi:chorismate mutase [Micromonospora echinofusca]|uniref:chorismate mutase n=1 Tax=Micromonospora echinofusca TaxID=47858 RepID=UPI003442AA2E
MSGDDEGTGVEHDLRAQKEIIVRRGTIDLLDDEILALIRRRREVSAEIQAIRISAGGSRIATRREHVVVSRYTAALGSRGAELAAVILRISRQGPGAVR